MKYVNTVGNVSVKNRIEFSDYDYIHKLSYKEKLWLRKFHQEYLQASFTHEDPLHPKTMRKSCTDSNNARNRDIYALAKSRKMLFYIGYNEEVDKKILNNKFNEIFK